MAAPIVMESPYGGVILSECKRLTLLVRQISERYNGPVATSSSSNTLFPFVLLLGNHSSGKSSFINYVLQRNVQATGVAPTDDCFTVIGPGEEDVERDGRTLVGDPDLGFGDLRTFGTTLVNHTRLKVRKGIAVKDFMLVDSPGMIDSPASTHSQIGDYLAIDRGYHFEAVCKWYAERADVILLFFDPDKPGTTGETLSILTHSLVGFDNKLLIVLNKADQFTKIHDFARAYGSLCWNLSKVILRKDLPQIYTMCVPQDGHAGNDRPASNSPPDHAGLQRATSTSSPSQSVPFAESNCETRTFASQTSHDLEETRALVVREVFNAPRRRVDNEISRLFDNVAALSIHCKLVDEVVRVYQSTRMGFFAEMAICMGSGLAAGMLAWNIQSVAAVSRIVRNGSLISRDESWMSKVVDWVADGKLVGCVALGFGSWALSSMLRHRSQQNRYLASFARREGYARVFEGLFAKEIAAKDEFTQSVGKAVLDRIALNIPPTTIPNLGRIASEDMNALDRILRDDVVMLRRRASVNFPDANSTAVETVSSVSSLDTIGETATEAKEEAIDLEAQCPPHSLYSSTPK